MDLVDSNTITDKEAFIIKILKRNTTNFYSSKPHHISWKGEQNLLITSFCNKKHFNDFVSTFQWLSNSEGSYKGKWLSLFNEKKILLTQNNVWFTTNVYNTLKSNFKSSYIIDCLLEKKTKPLQKTFSLIGAHFENTQRLTIWLLLLDNSQKTSYKIYKETIYLHNLFWYKYFPFYFLIDTEFTDKIQDNSHPFENKRIRFPVSVTVTTVNISNGVKKTHHYLFNKNHLTYLEPYKNNDDLSLIQYNDKLPLYTNQSKPLLIKENTGFKHVLYDIFKHMISNLKINDCKLYLFSCQTPNSGIYLKKSYKILIKMFWSAKDLKYFFGYVCYRFMEPLFNTKSNNLTFEKHKIKSNFGFIFKFGESEYYFSLQILDISKLSERGLQDLANLTGIELSLKQDLNKIDISQSLINEPSKYIQYCREDTENLDIMVKRAYTNLIELYELFNIKNIPSLVDFSSSNHSINYMRYSTGSNVSRFFQEYIYSLDPSMKRTLELLNVQAGDNTVIQGISMGSSRYLNFLGSHASIGAFTMGGRCSNEIPLLTNLETGCDLDLSSAYSNGLRSCLYCVGIPYVVRPLEDIIINETGEIKYTNEPFIGNLNEILKSYKKYLVPNCWMMIVSTKEPLSFSFDLLVSKNINLSANKYKPEQNSNSTNVPGEQFILLHEVKNTVLTQSSLDIIDNVATRSEKKELYKKLIVKEVIYYDKRYKCETISEFNLKVCNWFIDQEKKKNKGGRPKLNKDYVGLGSKKNKPHYWYGVEMEEFMSRLISIRKNYQKLYREKKDPVMDSKQRYTKLLCNMLYGCTASRFFDINNLVFANNCTGLCRSAVWLKAKCLNLAQVVTDGGLCSLNRVNYWHLLDKKHKPGFNILSKNAIYQNSNFIKPLGYGLNINWEKHLKKTCNNEGYNNKVNKIIDYLTNKHLKKFLNYYNLNEKRVFPYKIESKSDNLFFKACTVGRGHYALQQTNGEFIYKVRGTQQKNEEGVKSPIFNILKGKMFFQDAPIYNLSYSKSILVKSHDIEKIRSEIPNIGLHDAYIILMTLKIKLDCGIYAFFENFKLSTKKNFEKHHYSYLKSDYFITSENPCILKANFWSFYEKELHDLCLTELNKNQKTKRFAKSKEKEFFKLIETGCKCDPFFKHNLKNELKQKYNDEDINENYFEESNDFFSNKSEIPILSDDSKENEFLDYIESELSG